MSEPLIPYTNDHLRALSFDLVSRMRVGQLCNGLQYVSIDASLSMDHECARDLRRGLRLRCSRSFASAVRRGIQTQTMSVTVTASLRGIYFDASSIAAEPAIAGA